jgi:hypothetical protein
MVKVQPSSKRRHRFLNTTDGSPWMVKVQPSKKGSAPLPEYHGRESVDG